MLLRLATLNLAFVDHNGGPDADPSRPLFPPWQERCAHIGRVLTELHPHLICLQEAVSWQAEEMAPRWLRWLEQRSAFRPLPQHFDQVAELMDCLPHDYRVVGTPLPTSYFQGERMDGLGWGTVVLTRLPVLSHHRITLPHEPGDMTRRRPLLVEVEVEGELMWVASIHCDPLERHVDSLRGAIDAVSPEVGVALLGDFNLDDRHPLYRRLVGADLVDCRHASTPTLRWRDDAPCPSDTTIDHCLVRDSSRVPVAFYHINDHPYSDIHWLQVVDLAQRSSTKIAG